MGRNLFATAVASSVGLIRTGPIDGDSRTTRTLFGARESRMAGEAHAETFLATGRLGRAFRDITRRAKEATTFDTHILDEAARLIARVHRAGFEVIGILRVMEDASGFGAAVIGASKTVINIDRRMEAAVGTGSAVAEVWIAIVIRAK